MTPAEEERDALLAALGFKPGPFRDAGTRAVILGDAAGLRPAMVKARRRADDAEGSAMMYHAILGEFVHDSRSGVLGRLWEEVKRLRRLIPRRPIDAGYRGPVVSLTYRKPYYLASCDACGWVGSSEACGSDTGQDDSDVYCPRCHAPGADCGKVAAQLEHVEPKREEG